MKLNKTATNNQLNLRLDDDGLIKCYGILTNADLLQETITPILFPRKKNLVQLMTEEYQ